MENALYPASPAGTGPDRLSISSSFRRQVGKVIGSITLFIIVYLLLVLAAIILAIACCWLGIWIIMEMPKFITLLIGLGLMGVGVSVIFFLVKFMFAVSKDENPGRVEITEAEQPRLFAFIRRLTAETNTPFPKKIYISPDVNAAVFYNSGFWSMFLPVRKNLEIGLGLVNSINISEFKAVMAHEFGHFSQRSMKLGSFTYNVNKVIYNMLYDNNSYTNFLNAWGNIHGYLSLFAGITVKIARGIQWILKGMYTIINRNYLGLSREMEFHADAVAASVSGGNNLVGALSRIEVAGNCYNTALKEANDRLKENKIARNIFVNQLTVLRSMAAEYRLPVKEGLPEISYHFVRSFSRSRINYKNQWASHPTLEERKAHLDQLDITVAPDNTPVWALFSEAESLQEKITGQLYQAVSIKEDTGVYDGAEFEARYAGKKEKYALPGVYKGYYDGRYISMEDWHPAALIGPPPQKTIDDLFNEETGQLHTTINNNRNDLEIVRAIKDKKIDITSFDFDGQKYTRNECDGVIARLEKNITEGMERQRQLDMEVFLFFLYRSEDNPAITKGLIRGHYCAYKSVDEQYDQYVTLANKALEAINPFYGEGIGLEQVNAIVRSIKIEHEPTLKKAWQQLTDTGLITPATEGELHEKIKDFAGKNYYYFINNQFQDNELSEFSGLIVKVAEELNNAKFDSYKRMLEAQATCI